MPARPRGEVVLAVVTGAHGIGGEVRLKVFADDLSAFASFNDGTLTATAIRKAGDGAIARFAEVPDRTAAENLRGTYLTVPRTALPPLAEGEYYHADLIGLSVVTADGTAIGTVSDIANFGAGDIIEIDRPTRPSVMVPLTKAAAPDWNDERLIVDPAWLD